jgi:hypothetical protein
MGKMTEELDTEVTPRKKIEDLYELVDGIGTAMRRRVALTACS